MSQTLAGPGTGRSTSRPGATAVPVPPPTGGTPGPGLPGRLRSRLSRSFEGSPGRLRAAAVIGVLVCLVFAALGGNAFRARGDALDEARKDASQLVRVRQIAIDVASADALVTNAFLQGAGEPAGVVSRYQDAIGRATTELAEAAQAEPGDAAALGAANSALARYTAAVASARANNRQQFQVGSGYLRQASDLLRTASPGKPAVLPTLDAVAAADGRRVDDAFSAAQRATYELALAGLVVLAGLLAVQVWLARRTRRYLNVPLTWGTGAVLVCLVAGLIVLVSGQSAANRLRDTHYAAMQALSQARIAAFDARANEALTLVYQGSGQTYEAAYGTLLATARQQVSAAQGARTADAGASQLAAWAALHKGIRDRDDNGDWAGAVAQATGPAQQAFDAFDRASNEALTTQASATTGGLDDRHWLLVALGWITLLAGLFAAGAAGVGVAQRLGEYR